jgi:transcription elongation factor GreB
LRGKYNEYICSKERLRGSDRELKHLGDRLKVLKVVYPPHNPTSVSYGCWVAYEDENGEKRCHQLVGPDEFDVTVGRISVDSPVGSALLGKKVDDGTPSSVPPGILP